LQICGSNPFAMAKCAQVLQEKIDINFIDINMGCPIDLIYQQVSISRVVANTLFTINIISFQGAGSGLLKRQNILEHMVRSMAQVMTIPLTIKTRTGVYSDKRLAHNLIPRLKNWGVSLITVNISSLIVSNKFNFCI